jgi:lipopolysaccharide/colanic/teichoic acid biosynthesis glycosyltransferase
MSTQKSTLSQAIPNGLAMATNVALVAAGRSWEERTAKRLMDVAFGMLGSFLTFLITPFVALFLKLEDGGPVFFAREFVDCDGSVRHYLKFRTMVTNAEERLRDDPELKRAFDTKYKLQTDPRVLRIGRVLRKYSIDECPQFFSILTGKLTLVGPRVISQEETSRYGDLLPKLLSVKPGLTGYWQVMGRQNTSYQQRIAMDMHYIDHWSLGLDLRIVALTLWKVVRAEGAY